MFGQGGANPLDQQIGTESNYLEDQQPYLVQPNTPGSAADVSTEGLSSTSTRGGEAGND